MDLPIKEKAFVIASIQVRGEDEKKREAELKSKMRKGRARRK